MTQYIITIEYEMIDTKADTEFYYKVTITDQFKRITRVYDGPDFAAVMKMVNDQMFLDLRGH